MLVNRKKLSTSLIIILTNCIKMTAYESKTSYSYNNFHYKNYHYIQMLIS